MIDPAEQFKFEMPLKTESGQAFEVGFAADFESPYFNGHFPNEPVLPAVAMIDACLIILSRAFPDMNPQIERVISSKFLNKISPNQQVRIRVESKSPSAWMFYWFEPSSKASLAQVELAISPMAS